MKFVDKFIVSTTLIGELLIYCNRHTGLTNNSVCCHYNSNN